MTSIPYKCSSHLPCVSVVMTFFDMFVLRFSFKLERQPTRTPNVH